MSAFYLEKELLLGALKIKFLGSPCHSSLSVPDPSPYSVRFTSSDELSVQTPGRAVGGEPGLCDSFHVDPAPQRGGSGLSGHPVSS